MRDKLRRKKRRTKKNQHIIVIFCIATNFAFHRTNIENVENDDFENDDPDQHIFLTIGIFLKKEVRTWSRAAS